MSSPARLEPAPQLPDPAAEAGSLPSAFTPPAVPEGSLMPGDRIVLFAMNKHPDLNNQQGSLKEVYSGEGEKLRWLVQVDGRSQPLAIRVTNIKRAPPAVPAQAAGQRPTGAQPASGSADARHASSSARQTVSEVPKRQARLLTRFGAEPLVRVPELPNALASGQRSFVLGGFVVERVNAKEDMFLRARCKICGASFGWRGGCINEAKRRRQTLACGHWVYDLAFEFELVLRDAAYPSAPGVKVAICEQQDVMFGIAPEEAAKDPSALERAKEMLQELLAYEGTSNLMTVVVSPYPQDVLLAVDSGIKPEGGANFQREY